MDALQLDSSLTGSGLQRCRRQLQDRLEEICRRAQLDEACAGVVNSAGECHAVVSSSQAATFDIHLACITKLLTASLICQRASQGEWALDTGILCLMPPSRRHACALQGITVAQLLNHTHGLDDAVLQHVLRRADGRVDSDALCESICSTAPLARPGELYSYGAGGACLAAALLEHQCGATYEEILHRSLLQPLHIRCRADCAHTSSPALPAVCPASGGRMIWSLEELISFLRWHLGLESPRGAARHLPLAFMFHPVAPLSGWHPIEHGVAAGWKFYGHGWFGHNAHMADCSVLLRLHPQRRLAVVVAVRTDKGEAAFRILSALFADEWPELAVFRWPRLLARHEWQHRDIHQFTGMFANSICTVRVEESAGTLLLTTDGGRGSENRTAVALRPARQQIFLPQPAAGSVFPFVQFIRPAGNGKYRYLWNGQQVWRWSDATLPCPATLAI